MSKVERITSGRFLKLHKRSKHVQTLVRAWEVANGEKIGSVLREVQRLLVWLIIGVVLLLASMGAVWYYGWSWVTGLCLTFTVLFALVRWTLYGVGTRCLADLNLLQDLSQTPVDQPVGEIQSGLRNELQNAVQRLVQVGVDRRKLPRPSNIGALLDWGYATDRLNATERHQWRIQDEIGRVAPAFLLDVSLLDESELRA